MFDEIADLVVYAGSVGFSGIVTFEAEEGVEALLEINFLGRAAPAGRNVPEIVVRQRGTMRLVRTSGRWAVDGYDLRLATRPAATPTPSPEIP